MKGGFACPATIYFIIVNGFTLEKQESGDTPHKSLRTQTTLMIALLADTPTKAESLLHSLERAAHSIGLHVNANKTDFMCFNQR